MYLISKHLVKGIKLNTDSLPNMSSANGTVIKIGQLSKLELVMGVRILQIKNVFFGTEQLAGTDTYDRGEFIVVYAWSRNTLQEEAHHTNYTNRKESKNRYE